LDSGNHEGYVNDSCSEKITFKRPKWKKRIHVVHPRVWGKGFGGGVVNKLRIIVPLVCSSLYTLPFHTNTTTITLSLEEQITIFEQKFGDVISFQCNFHILLLLQSRQTPTNPATFLPLVFISPPPPTIIKNKQIKPIQDNPTIVDFDPNPKSANLKPHKAGYLWREVEFETHQSISCKLQVPY